MNTNKMQFSTLSKLTASVMLRGTSGRCQTAKDVATNIFLSISHKYFKFFCFVLPSPVFMPKQTSKSHLLMKDVIKIGRRAIQLFKRLL